MLVGVASRLPEYRHFTVETGKTAYTFATQCIKYRRSDLALSVVLTDVCLDSYIV